MLCLSLSLPHSLSVSFFAIPLPLHSLFIISYYSKFNSLNADSFYVLFDSYWFPATVVFVTDGQITQYELPTWKKINNNNLYGQKLNGRGRKHWSNYTS